MDGPQESTTFKTEFKKGHFQKRCLYDGSIWSYFPVLQKQKGMSYKYHHASVLRISLTNVLCNWTSTTAGGAMNQLQHNRWLRHDRADWPADSRVSEFLRKCLWWRGPIDGNLKPVGQYKVRQHGEKHVALSNQTLNCNPPVSHLHKWLYSSRQRTCDLSPLPSETN